MPMILLEALGLALATELCLLAVNAMASGISNTVHQVFKNADPFRVQLAISVVISLSLLTVLWSKALKAAGDSRLRRLFRSLGWAIVSTGSCYAAQALGLAISSLLVQGQEGADNGPVVLVYMILSSFLPTIILMTMFWMCVLLLRRKQRRVLAAT